MTKRTRNVFLSAFFAAFVGTAVTTFVTTRPSISAGALQPPVLAPSEVVRIDHRDGAATRQAPGRWTVTIAGEDTQWPGSTAAIREALRAAADISRIDSTAHDGDAPGNAFTFGTASENTRTLALAEASIGGMRSVVIDGDFTVRAPAALVEKLLAGPRAWRDTTLFPNAGPNVTRLLIRQPATESDGAREIDITKTAGRWLLASPVLARASDDAMRSAIARVASSSIVRFLDEAPSDLESGLDQPSFVITVEAGDDVRRLSFGASANAAGTERFATTGAGHYFIADTELLRELRLDPAAYTDRRPSAVVPADVHGVRVDDARAQRTLSGWSDAPFDAGGVLAMLTRDFGGIVAFETPAGWSPGATVTLEDLAGEPLDVIGVGRDASGAVYARTQMPGGGPVFYSLPRESAAAILGETVR